MRAKILFLGILLCTLVACTGGNELNINISPTDKSITELITKTYTTKDLNAISTFQGTIEDLALNYPVECIRKTDIGFRVVYLGEDRVAIITFDSNGYKISGYTSILSKSRIAFENISEKSLLSDIQTIDPYGYYPFLYTGRNDIPKRSIHHTSDGYLIIIEYDESNKVIGINSSFI